MWNVKICTGEQLKEILKNIWHAKEEDFPPLQDVCDNMNNDPFLHYRKGSKYELIFNLNLKNAYRAKRKPFILDVKDGYKRDDSGIHRFFGETQDWTLQNTAFQALQSFKVKIVVYLIWILLFQVNIRNIYLMLCTYFKYLLITICTLSYKRNNTNSMYIFFFSRLTWLKMQKI